MRLPLQRFASVFVLSAALAVLGAFGAPGKGDAFPIVNPLGETIFPQFTVVVPRLSVLQASGTMPGVSNATFHESDYSLGFAYGVTPTFTVSALAPYVVRDLTLTLPDGQQSTRRASGVGDLTLVGSDRVFRQDDPLPRRGSTQAFVFGGIKLPTGRTDLRDAQGLLPPSLQPGSGSVDGLVGVAGLRNIGETTFYGLLAYKVNGEGQTGGARVQMGNTLLYDLAVDRVIMATPTSTLFAVLELNGMVADQNAVNGARDPNSGGHVLFISPGLQYLPGPNLILEASVQFPIVKALNGTQLQPGTNWVVGLRYFVTF